MSATVKFQDVGKIYQLDHGGSCEALKDLSFSVFPGKMLSIVGRNGTGKSTILSLISGLTAPTTGSIEVIPEDSLRIGLMWQDYRTSLLPWRSIMGNLMFPFQLTKTQNLETHKAEAEQLLGAYLPSVKPEQRVCELSGGQQQMVALLRCALQNPHLYLFDEPFAAIDQFRRWEWLERSEKIRVKAGATGIFVSHDLDEAIMAADEVLVLMEDGSSTIISNGCPRPRSIETLTDALHLECKSKILALMSPSFPKQ